VDLEDYDLDDMPPLEDDDSDDMSPLEDMAVGEHLDMVRAQHGMDFDAIIAAIANGSVSVRNDGLEV